MKAVQKFDPDKEIRLISYAVWWIRAYIQNHILKSWSLVKIGTTQAQRKLFFSLARTRHEIERLTPGAGLDEGVDANGGQAAEGADQRRGGDDPADGGARPLARRAGGATGPARTSSSRPPRATARTRSSPRPRRTPWSTGASPRPSNRLDPRERHIVEARVMGEGKETLRDSATTSASRGSGPGSSRSGRWRSCGATSSRWPARSGWPLGDGGRGLVSRRVPLHREARAAPAPREQLQHGHVHVRRAGDAIEDGVGDVLRR